MGIVRGWLGRIGAAVALIHPAPTVAVVALSGALGAILLDQAGRPLDRAWLLTVVSVAGSQVLVGSLNDIADEERDAAAGRNKPLAAGRLSTSAALWIASAGLAVQVVASWQLGALALGLGLVATASAVAYDLFLSRTVLSPLPYVVSFGILPAWIAAGIDLPLERVLPGIPLAAAFAAAAHLANALRDYDVDAGLGSGTLAQRLGRRTTHLLAAGLALAVGVGVGAALLVGGRVGGASLALGAIGLLAVGMGLGAAHRLWPGMLVAAVAWTAAWALSTG